MDLQGEAYLMGNYIQNSIAAGAAQGKASRLGRLVSQGLEAPGQRQSTLADIAKTVGAAEAQTASQMYQGEDDARNERLATSARVLLGAPEAQKPTVYEQMRPELAQILGSDPGPYSPELLQFASQIDGAFSGGEGGLPADIRTLQMLRDDPGLMEINDRYRGTQSFREIERADGTIDIFGVNNRSGLGGIVPIGGGFPPPQPPAAAHPGPMQSDSTIDAAIAQLEALEGPLPDYVKAKIRAEMAQDGTFTVGNRPGGQPVAPPAAPPVMRPQGGSGLGASNADRSAAAAAQAAEVEAAKLRTQLGFAPAVAEAEADAAGKKKAAEAEAERAAGAPKRLKAYEQALAASGNVITAIDDADKLIGLTSTGFLGARLRDTEGSKAFDLKSAIETVKSNLGFDRLQQMRDNSPTGGALGAIAVQELTALQSTIANLDPDQSEPQIRASLAKVRKHYTAWQEAIKQAIADEESKGQSSPQGGQSRLVFSPATGELE